MSSVSVKEALLKECRELAAFQLYNTDKAEYIREIWTSEEREELARRYYGITCKWLVGADDPWMIVRAVSFFGNLMPKPFDDPMDVSWIGELWWAYYGLVRPSSGTPKGGEPFFEDIRKGMAQAEEWGRELDNN